MNKPTRYFTEADLLQKIDMKSIIKNVIKREGGYVNDPADRGGETKYGISKRAHPDIDIEHLTLDQAVEIYHLFYWHPSKADKIPERLREYYFDMVVNMGQGNAVKTLQRACINKGLKLDVDGRIGPKTIKACRKLELNRLRAFRVLYYAHLALRREGQMKFYYGWFNRSLEV